MVDVGIGTGRNPVRLDRSEQKCGCDTQAVLHAVRVGGSIDVEQPIRAQPTANGVIHR